MSDLISRAEPLTIEQLHREGQFKSRRLRHVIMVLLPVLLVVGWTAAASTISLVPGISETLRALAASVQDGTIGSQLAATMKAVMAGYLMAAVVGLGVAFPLGRSPYWYRTLEPVIGAAFAVPRILLYPVLLAMFGYGIRSTIGVGFLSAVFPIMVATMAGSREVAPILIKLADSMTMSRSQRLWKVMFPAAAPTVMAGLRMGIGSAFISVVVAEMVGAPAGLGVLVKESYSSLALPTMYGVIFLIVVLALLFNFTLRRIEAMVQRSVD